MWFFHTFKVGEQSYAYDTRTNLVLKVEEKLKDVNSELLQISVAEAYRESFGKEVLQELEEFSGINEVRFPLNKEQIVDSIEHKMTELVLNVTEDCNFGCNYCIFSGKYPLERTHSKFRMSKQTAQRAIDFFFEHNKETNPVYVGFYGGEPLLNFDIIHFCTDYVRRQYRDRRTRFVMTTNGALLTPEKFNVLVDNEFLLQVSLDGPEEIHDRNRRYLKGLSTYDVIMSNLRRLKSYSPDYFEKVGLISVISDPRDLKAVNDFFKTNDLVEGHRVMPTFVYPYDTTFNFPPNYEETTDKELSDLAEEHMQSIIRGGEFNRFLQGLFDTNLRRIHKREMKLIEPYIQMKGPCVPGSRKIFVQTSGDLYVCERVGGGFRIGNLESGIDHTRVTGLIKEYSDLRKTACANCWAVRLCKSCYIHANKGGKLDQERQQENCKIIRSNLSKALSMYTRIQEEVPKTLQSYFEQNQPLEDAFTDEYR